MLNNDARFLNEGLRYVLPGVEVGNIRPTDYIRSVYLEAEVCEGVPFIASVGVGRRAVKLYCNCRCIVRRVYSRFGHVEPEVEASVRTTVSSVVILGRTCHSLTP